MVENELSEINKKLSKITEVLEDILLTLKTTTKPQDKPPEKAVAMPSSKKSTLLDIVKDLEDKNITRDDVISEAKKRGIYEYNETRNILDRLLRETGEIYETREGYLKFARQKQSK
jgi:hypothetical protein